MAVLKPQTSQTSPLVNQVHSIIPSHSNDGDMSKFSSIFLCLSVHST